MGDISAADLIKSRYRHVVGIISFQVRMQTKEGRRSLAKEMHEYNLNNAEYIRFSLPYHCLPKYKNYIIDSKVCFKSTSQTPDILYDMFTRMISNFDWYNDQIGRLIYNHSIFGVAYIRACERASKTKAIMRPKGLKSLPDRDMVMEEFRKILIKSMCDDFKVDREIYDNYIRMK